MDYLFSGDPRPQDLLDYMGVSQDGTPANEPVIAPVVDHDAYFARQPANAKRSVNLQTKCADIQAKQQETEERLRAAIAALPPHPMAYKEIPPVILKPFSESGPSPKSGSPCSVSVSAPASTPAPDLC